MAVSSCTFYDDYIEHAIHAIEDMVLFGQIVAKSHFVTNIVLNKIEKKEKGSSH